MIPADKIFRIDRKSSLYPERLKWIHDPPEMLYCAGNPELLQSRCTGVVGSRRYTLYGKMTAIMIGRHLAEAGITVVSGLAFGIDAFAHQGALEAGGAAIAVLGMGHQQFGPARNRDLYRQVLETGVVVSEYEPERRAEPWMFPRRNRIISGLSENVVVVEAGMNSGSLITAQLAAEQGREVYAVPGNINSQFSVGTNFLIRDGARPLIVLDDLVADMGIDRSAERREKHSALGEDEERLYEVIREAQGITVDDLARSVGMQTGPMNSILTVMEIKGVIVSYGGKLYTAG